MQRKAPQPGERFVLVDEVGGGVVLRQERPGHLWVRTDEGFELELPVRALVAAPRERTAQLERITDHQAGMVAANDALADQRRRHRHRSPMRPGKTPKRPEDNSVAEVDLHLHELVDDERMLSDGEKLEFQIRYFERELEAAIRNGKRKLFVIHGVGEGILREEVRRILQYYENVQFHDADMRRYGSGATEVIILRHR